MNSRLPERPFFIVGSPRSGTTLLRFILSSHPRIDIPAETGFIPFLNVEPNAELTEGQVRRLLARIGELNRDWQGLVPDVPAFCSALSGTRLSHVLDALYRIQIAASGASRWADKTPGYVLYLERLASIFSTAQFVHVVRDGRDAALSARAKWGKGRWYMDTHYLLRNWVRYVDRGRAAGQRLGARRYLEVQYEALVAQPESVLREVCAFLEEEWHGALLDHTLLARERIRPDGHIEVRAPISARSVGRWKAEMSAFEAALADRVAGRTLLAMGYELSGQRITTVQEHLQLLLLTTKYAATSFGREALTTLGWLTLNRGKRRIG